MTAPDRLRACDFEVRAIPRRGEAFQEARRFVADNHYAGGCSNTAVYADGLYRRGQDELLGVALWLPPTRVAAESVNKAEWRRVLSLSRLCVRGDVPRNGASFLMAKSIRRIRAEGRFASLVTYADEFMGHSGAIYRATNWSFIGSGSKQPRWEDSDGRQVAKKATRTRTNAEMRALGHRLVGAYRKHKFVMHLEAPTNLLPFRRSESLLAWALVA